MLFNCAIKLSSHVVKKNGKSAFFNKKTGHAWVTRKPEAILAENNLINYFKFYKNQQLDKTIEGDIHCKFTFIFSEDKYYTKQMKRSKLIPDLSNLYELPQDALQKADVISDDANICSHDGSRRRPGKETMLIVEIFKFNG